MVGVEPVSRLEVDVVDHDMGVRDVPLVVVVVDDGHLVRPKVLRRPCLRELAKLGHA